MTEPRDAPVIKPDCYQCKHRRDVPGSAHSRCEHPKVGKKNEVVELLSMLGGGHHPPLPMGLNVRGNPHGIKRGWFGWPFNFDPVWLEECDGFEEKQA